MRICEGGVVEECEKAVAGNKELVSWLAHNSK